MSKTDKTKPFWVKLRHGDLRAVEEHDHRDGVCNLPDEPGETLYGPDHRYDCQWEFVYDGTHVCCCSSCHGYDSWDISPQRRRRIEGKKACRTWADEY